MTLAEQIEALEVELEEFRSGEKFIGMQDRIAELELERSSEITALENKLSDSEEETSELYEKMEKITDIISAL